jgi:3-oxoacyl-[acyl-carrier-protein] synthase II
MVAPRPDGGDVAEAIELCLRDAGMAAAEVDYINAHGTGTVYNDSAETKAIKAAFGRRAYDVPISSTKSMIGHTIGAAGSIEAIVSILALKCQRIPPTINLEHADPECDLDYVPHASRSARLGAVLSNSCGFGSSNAVLLFRELR